MRHNFVVQWHLGAQLFTQRRPSKLKLLPTRCKRPVYPLAPTRGGAHLQPSLLIAYPSAPPKRSEAPCLPGGAHAKWCPLPPLLFSAYTHRPTSPKRGNAPSSRRRPREAARIYRCPCPVLNQRRPPNAAKRLAYLVAPTRTGALRRRTCLVPTLRLLSKAAKHPV